MPMGISLVRVVLIVASTISALQTCSLAHKTSFSLLEPNGPSQRIRVDPKRFYIFDVNGSSCKHDCYTTVRLSLIKAHCDSITAFTQTGTIRARCYSRGVRIMKSHPKIGRIQRDRKVLFSTTSNNSAPGFAFTEIHNRNISATDVRNNVTYDFWSHDRIDQQNLPLDHRPFSTSMYPNKGKGVRVFVIDTGCSPTHEQLVGRINVLPAPGSKFSSGYDDHSHGTHIASTVAGSSIGIAPEAHVTCIKALSSLNEGRSSDVIASINIASDFKKQNPHVPVIISLSLGIKAPRTYIALDQAINRAARSGVIPIVAAGNDGGDACHSTPGRAAHALTVASTTQEDTLASYSNRGACVDLVGPGESILAAHSSSDTAFARASGTSMAVPHAVGLVALMLGEKATGNVMQVKTWIVEGAPTVEGYPLVYVGQR